MVKRKTTTPVSRMALVLHSLPGDGDDACPTSAADTRRPDSCRPARRGPWPGTSGVRPATAAGRAVPPASVESEELVEDKDGEEPAEEVRERHAEEAATISRYPQPLNGRAVGIHTDIPHDHDERCGDRQRRIAQRRYAGHDPACPAARSPPPTTGSRCRSRRARSGPGPDRGEAQALPA